MPDFTIYGFNHTSFTVADLDRSVAFFCEALGFELLNKAPRSPEAVQHISGIEGADMIVAFIQGPGHRLELIQYHGPADRGEVDCRPCDSGFAHVAYDVDDVDAAVAASAAVPPAERMSRATRAARGSSTIAPPTNPSMAPISPNFGAGSLQPASASTETANAAS